MKYLKIFMVCGLFTANVWGVSDIPNEDYVRSLTNSEFIELIHNLGGVIVGYHPPKLPSNSSEFINLVRNHENLSDAAKSYRLEVERLESIQLAQQERLNFKISDYKEEMLKGYYKHASIDCNHLLAENVTNILLRRFEYCFQEIERKSINSEISFRNLKKIYEKNQWEFLKTFKIRNSEVVWFPMELKKRQYLFEAVMFNILNEKMRLALDESRNILNYKKDRNILNSYINNQIQDIKQFYWGNINKLKRKFCSALNKIHAQEIAKKQQQYQRNKRK